jgi:hypothetical protein
MKTNQAQAAAQIRKQLKALGIPARVKSKGFSMGDSVDVYLTDATPEVVAQVKELTAPYQYGNFNGMEDIYEYSNRNADIPQTKFLFVNNEISDELRAKATTFVDNYYGDTCDKGSLVHQTLNGVAENGFWEATPVPAADPTRITEQDLIDMNAGFVNPPKMIRIVRDEWAESAAKFI